MYRPQVTSRLRPVMPSPSANCTQVGDEAERRITAGEERHPAPVRAAADERFLEHELASHQIVDLPAACRAPACAGGRSAPAAAAAPSECGSLRSPKTSAFSVQASTQAGCWPLPSRSSQKVHFSTTPFVRVGKSGVGDFRNGRGSDPVEAARAVRTRGHAVAAADAAVPVHHHDAVVAPPGGLGRADPHAGRVVAVVAEHQDRLAGQAPRRRTRLLVREGALERLLPDPLDLVPRVGDRRARCGRRGRRRCSPCSRPPRGTCGDR